MKYPYTVKYRGTWYLAGEEVPMGERKVAVAKPEPEPKVSAAQTAQKPTVSVTKQGIMRMNRIELVKLAKSIGVEIPDDMPAKVIRETLVQQLGL